METQHANNNNKNSNANQFNLFFSSTNPSSENSNQGELFNYIQHCSNSQNNNNNDYPDFPFDPEPNSLGIEMISDASLVRGVTSNSQSQNQKNSNNTTTITTTTLKRKVVQDDEEDGEISSKKKKSTTTTTTKNPNTEIEIDVSEQETKESMNNYEDSDVLFFMLTYTITRHMGMQVDQYDNMIQEMFGIFRNYTKSLKMVASSKQIETTTLEVLSELGHQNLTPYRNHIHQASELNGPALLEAILSLNKSKPTDYVKRIMEIITIPTMPTMEYAFQNPSISKELSGIYNSIIIMGYRNENQDPNVFDSKSVNPPSIIASTTESFIKQISENGQVVPLLVCAYYKTWKDQRKSRPKEEIYNKDQLAIHVPTANKIKKRNSNIYELPQKLAITWRAMAMRNDWEAITNNFDIFLRGSLTPDECYNGLMKLVV